MIVVSSEQSWETAYLVNVGVIDSLMASGHRGSGDTGIR